MMLVSNVALGNCKDFTEYQKDLQGPPEGYESCHGVASSEDQPSEFMVYNLRQCTFCVVVKLKISIPTFWVFFLSFALQYTQTFQKTFLSFQNINNLPLMTYNYYQS